jgi:hypothetical protein
VLDGRQQKAPLDGGAFVVTRRGLVDLPSRRSATATITLAIVILAARAAVFNI